MFQMHQRILRSSSLSLPHILNLQSSPFQLSDLEILYRSFLRQSSFQLSPESFCDLLYLSVSRSQHHWTATGQYTPLIPPISVSWWPELYLPSCWTRTPDELKVVLQPEPRMVPATEGTGLPNVCWMDEQRPEGASGETLSISASPVMMRLYFSPPLL